MLQKCIVSLFKNNKSVYFGYNCLGCSVKFGLVSISQQLNWPCILSHKMKMAGNWVKLCVIC